MKFIKTIKMNINAKMLLYILSTAVGIYLLSFGYITYHTMTTAMNDAEKLANAEADKYGNVTKLQLESASDATRTLAQSFLGYESIPQNIRRTTFNDLLKNVLYANPDFLSVWAIWEKNAIDGMDTAFKNTAGSNDAGRYVPMFYRQGNEIVMGTDSESDTESSQFYTTPKTTKQECLFAPYYYAYQKNKTKEIFETSIAIPIIKNNVFLGVVGIDIGLEKFQPLIESIKPFDVGFAFLISNEGIIVAHPLKEKVGKKIKNSDLTDDENLFVLDSIKKGTRLTFSSQLGDEGDEQEFYTSLHPIIIGKTLTPWTFGISIPVSKMKEQANKGLLISLIVGILGFILLTFVIWVFSKKITSSILVTTKTLQDIAIGDIDQTKKINISTKDEMEEMANSVNTLIDGLNSTVIFANEIGAGNLNADFKTLSDKDKLGTSLLEMRKSLQLAENEDNARKIEDEKRNWTTGGLAKFGDILRQDNDKIDVLSYNIIRNLVKYLESNQGGLFLLNDEKSEKFLELSACFAFDRQKFIHKRIEIGDGLVGACFLEKKTIYLTNVPNNYITITSGLGGDNPRAILIVPLKLNDEVYGVIEIASFRTFKPHEIEFVEKIAESIASTISSVKINIRTAQLLEESQKKAEEMKAQEEEMRQNLEELAATQESLAEKDRLQRYEIENLIKSNEQKLKEIQIREEQSRGILEGCLDSVIIFDHNGNITFFNRAAEQFWGYTKNEILGKHLKLLIPQLFSQGGEFSQDDFLSVGIKNLIGKDKEADIIRKDATKAPALVSFIETLVANNSVYTAFIKDLTEQKKAEEILTLKENQQRNEIKRLKEKHTQQLEMLRSQEEEIKQNLEELTATQEQMAQREIEMKGVLNAIDNSVATLEFDVKGNVIFANDKFLRALNIRKEEVMGKNYNDLFIIEDSTTEQERISWEKLIQGITQYREFHYKLSKGDAWFYETYTPVKDNNDVVYKVISLMVDITERKKAEKVQNVLYNILTDVHTCDTLDELFHSIHKHLSKIINTNNFYIAFLDEETEMVSFPYFVDENDPAPASRKMKRGLTEFVFRSGKPSLITPEIWEDLTFKGEITRIGTPAVDWLGVPLKTKNKKFGVMVVQSYNEKVRFDENDKKIFIMVSDQIAIAIERKKMEESLHNSQKSPNS